MHHGIDDDKAAMIPPTRRLIACLTGVVLLVVGSAAIGCSDVGDSSAVPGQDDASGSVVGAADGTVAPDGEAGGTPGLSDGALVEVGTDGSEDAAEPDVTESTSESGSTGPKDATANQGMQPDVGIDVGHVQDTGVGVVTGHDAGVEAAAGEAGIDATVDTGADVTTADTGTEAAADTGADVAAADSGADVAAADTGVDAGAEASAEAGGAVPCTMPGQTNCVKCDGNTMHGDVCTPTEAIVVERDIAKGYMTGSQLNSTDGSPTESCYECMWKNGCIDDDVQGDTGQECGDLTGTVGAGAQASETKTQACLNTLTCVFQSGCADAKAQNPGATDGIQNCFCGSNGITIPLCEAAPTIAVGPASAAPNGSCAQLDIDGLGLTTSTAITPLVNGFTSNMTGAGMANNVFLCLGSNSGMFTCPTCFQ